MPTTQFIPTHDSNGTSNLMHLLPESSQQVLRSIRPGDVERVFGPGEDIDMPSKGYTDPEWYWQSSDGTVWGIGWRWGATRLRGRGTVSRGKFFFVHPSPDAATEFVAFLEREVA